MEAVIHLQQYSASYYAAVVDGVVIVCKQVDLFLSKQGRNKILLLPCLACGVRHAPEIRFYSHFNMHSNGIAVVIANILAF